MKSTADAVVVGGGVMGCSILYNLASHGMTDAVLLEKDLLVSGATNRSQGILRMHYSNEVTTRMAWESLKEFKEFDDLVGSSSGYVRTGYFLIVPPEDRRALEQNVAMQRRCGVDTRVASVEDASEIAPVVSVRGDEAVAYEPESGYADPYSVTIGYARRARQTGAKVRVNAPATQIDVAGGKVAAVSTPDGRIETPVAMIAAGPWSGPFLACMGIDVPLITVRHQVVMLRRPEEEVPEHPTIGDLTNSLSIRPEIGNLTLVGVGEDKSVGPSQYNQGVDMPVVEQVLRGLVSRMPGMAHALFRGGWSGLFTATPDWHPILDSVEGIEGLYCAVGFSGHGFKLAPVVGKVMAELITQGRTTSLDISALGLRRFSEGKLLGSRYRMRVLA